MARHRRRVLAVTASAGLVITALTVPTATAGAAPATATNGAAASSQRTAQVVASYTGFPVSATHSGGGAVNLGEDGSLTRYANRSASPRPAVATTASGNRALASPAAVSWLPTVSPTPTSGYRPGFVRRWEGLNEYSNQKLAGFSVEPPDQGLCAGNGHVLELINDAVSTYTTGGAVEHQAYLNDFFKEPAYQFTTDPSCVFDAATNRFFAVQLTLDVNPNTGATTGATWLDLAVSKTGDPNAGYTIYRVYTTDDGSNGTPVHSGCPCIGDFPHLATDAHGVYLTTNEYPFSDAGGVYGNNFNGAQVYALHKAAVAAGTPSVPVVQFENTRIPSSSGPLHPGFTLWPAQSAGTGYASSGNGTIYFVSSMAAEEARPGDFTGHANQIGVWWISNTSSLAATPSLTLNVKVLNVGNYGIPPLSNQKAGPVPLRDCLTVQCVPNLSDPYTPEQEAGFDSSDSRILTSYYANGVLYAALDTVMQVSGNVEAGVQWFSVNAANGSSTLNRSGYLGVAHNNVTYPSIATDTTGRGYMGLTLSGDNWYPSGAYTTFNAGPGSSVAVGAAGQAPQDGFCGYLAFNCGQTAIPTIRPRWGDYGYAAWDGNQFVVANEYIARSCSFATFQTDFTCGHTRTFYGNFSTLVEVLS